MAAKADSEAYNVPYEVKSGNGQFAVQFVPASEYGEMGSGQIQAIKEKDVKDLYRVDWYATHVQLSNDGHYLVRFGPWASDAQGLTDRAIAFYKDGTLLKSYQVKDLVHDSSSVDETISHYFWEASESGAPSGFSANDTRFTVTTTDKKAYIFDLATGKIISTHSDPKARSRRDIRNASEEQTEALAREYIERSPQLGAFAQLFSFTQLRAYSSRVGGAPLEGGGWSGQFQPLNPKLSRAMAEVNFHIDAKSDQVEVGFSPRELEQVLLELGAVSFVKKLLARRPENGYRVRADGKNYHWDSHEVVELIKAANGLKMPPLNRWIYFIVDTKEDYVSIYHPIGSDIFVVYSDPSSFPFSDTERARLKVVPGIKREPLAVVDSEGKLQTILYVPFRNPFLHR